MSHYPSRPGAKSNFSARSILRRQCEDLAENKKSDCISRNVPSRMPVDEWRLYFIDNHVLVLSLILVANHSTGKLCEN